MNIECLRTGYWRDRCFRAQLAFSFMQALLIIRSCQGREKQRAGDKNTRLVETDVVKLQRGLIAKTAKNTLKADRFRQPQLIEIVIISTRCPR